MKLILLSGLVLIALSNVNGEDHWSGCWTAFPAGSSICRSEFGDEYDSVDTETCNLVGKKALCRRSFPGCKATVCYSALVSELCRDQFGDDLPVKKDVFTDCSPGFNRHRCCPEYATDVL